MGPAGTICFRRLSSIRRIRVGWLGTRMGGALGLPVVCFYTGKGPQNQGCEEKNRPLTRPSTPTHLPGLTCAAIKVRRIPGSSGLINQYAFTYQIGNDSHVYGTTANFSADLGTTISTGVNNETLGISYSSTGNTTTALVGTDPITGALSNGTGLLSNY